MRGTVRRHHKHGVDLIKIMSTGGFMTEGSAPWFAQFEPAEVRAAVEEAHRVGKRVAAHVHGVVGIERALDAGVDTLEHCTFVQADGSHRIVPELADRVAASAAYVSPTWNLLLPLFQEWLPERDYVLEPLYRRGARIVASTDAGIDNVPHHGFVRSLQAMASSGLPTAEVLTAATTRAAEALGLATVTGALTAGLSADLIAVGGDPPGTIWPCCTTCGWCWPGANRSTPDPLPPIPPLRREDLPDFAFTTPGGRRTATAADRLAGRAALGWRSQHRGKGVRHGTVRARSSGGAWTTRRASGGTPPRAIDWITPADPGPGRLRRRRSTAGSRTPS